MDEATHGAGAHFRVITLVDEDLFSFGGNLDEDFLGLEGMVGGGENEVEDLIEVIFRERFEETDFVETVEKFGLKFAGIDEVFDEGFFEIFDGVAGSDLRADFVGAGVRSGDDDGITKTDFAVFFVAKDALVENL